MLDPYRAEAEMCAFTWRCRECSQLVREPVPSAVTADPLRFALRKLGRSEDSAWRCVACREARLDIALAELQRVLEAEAC